MKRFEELTKKHGSVKKLSSSEKAEYDGLSMAARHYHEQFSAGDYTGIIENASLRLNEANVGFKEKRDLKKMMLAIEKASAEQPQLDPHEKVEQLQALEAKIEKAEMRDTATPSKITRRVVQKLEQERDMLINDGKPPARKSSFLSGHSLRNSTGLSRRDALRQQALENSQTALLRSSGSSADLGVDAQHQLQEKLTYLQQARDELNQSFGSDKMLDRSIYIAERSPVTTKKSMIKLDENRSARLSLNSLDQRMEIVKHAMEHPSILAVATASEFELMAQMAQVSTLLTQIEQGTTRLASYDIGGIKYEVSDPECLDKLKEHLSLIKMVREDMPSSKQVHVKVDPVNLSTKDLNQASIDAKGKEEASEDSKENDASNGGPAYRK